jgi:putative transposase
MPAKNVLKPYEPGGFYHIYNRGVDKGIIFREDKDYKTFLSFLKLYLSLQSLQGESLKTFPSRKLKNYFGEIDLLCYCLMPNHFHLFVKQKSDHGIDHFMRSLATKYVRYFNSHYHRIGPLFQGPYKAVRVTDEYQFIYLSKYIHRNPLSISPYKESPRRLKEYTYSSYGNYLHLFSQSWVSMGSILSYFSQVNPQLNYVTFVEHSNADDVKSIMQVALDLE